MNIDLNWGLGFFRCSSGFFCVLLAATRPVKTSLTRSSFFHSQQTFSVPSALLIGNESTERVPLIANESWVIHFVCGSACLFGWMRGFRGWLRPKTGPSCIIHLAETLCTCEYELPPCVWRWIILDLDLARSHYCLLYSSRLTLNENVGPWAVKRPPWHKWHRKEPRHQKSLIYLPPKIFKRESKAFIFDSSGSLWTLAPCHIYTEDSKP